MGRKAYMPGQRRSGREETIPFYDGRLSSDTAFYMSARLSDLMDGQQDMKLQDLPSPRTVEWLSGVERADFIPTVAMVADLSGVLIAAGIDNDLYEEVLEFETHPFGSAARSIRLAHQLDPPRHLFGKDSEGIGRGIAPFETSIRARDRLLVTGPVVKFSGVLLAQGMLHLYLAGVSSVVALPTIISLVGVTTLVAMISLDWAERVLVALTGAFRTKAANDKLNEIRTIRKGSGLDPKEEGIWYQPDDTPHLLSKYRSKAIGRSLTADACERLACLFFLNYVMALVGLVLVFTFDPQAIVHQAIVGLSAIAVLSLTLLFHLKARYSQDSFQVYLSEGLGLVPGRHR